MLKISLKILLTIFIAFILFSFYMSPRLGGILDFGKDSIDKTIYHLEFDTVSTKDYGLNYNDNSEQPFYQELRTTYQLDSLVQDAKSDFEKILKIQSWVQSRWVHDCCNTPKENNALYILEQAEKGEQFRCVEYSIVARQCLTSLGFKVRGIGLMTKDISEVKAGGGHVVNEVYLKDIKKWVFIDPQFDIMTILNGMPLNAVELQNSIINDLDFEIINPNQTISKEDYINWISPYLYYFKTSVNGQSISNWDRIIGNKKQLTLYPKGAEQPTYFQNIFRINTTYYTHSVKDFYPEIE